MISTFCFFLTSFHNNNNNIVLLMSVVIYREVYLAPLLRTMKRKINKVEQETLPVFSISSHEYAFLNIC
jgi:hypothetical protein